MPPRRALPLGDSWPDEDAYVDSLLGFVTSSDILHNLCGGIHILDFLTRKPDLYTTVLPQEWRAWFDQVDIEEVLDVLLRDDVEALLLDPSEPDRASCLSPPRSLLEYIRKVRKHCLGREFKPCSASDEANSATSNPLPRQIAVGMKPKKMHEVQNFARYVDKLSADIAPDGEQGIPHIVDFGSGQNYLGRTLANPPYNKHVIAIERKHHNISGARGMDVSARLVEKPKVMRNKKEFKRLLTGEVIPGDMKTLLLSEAPVESSIDDGRHGSPDLNKAPRMEKSILFAGKGSMTYVEHDIQDGYLTYINDEASIPDPIAPEQLAFSECQDKTGSDGTPGMIVVSLHSCGNLLHHGLRSIVLNPTVSAVAMIGCCYNLMTERRGPATYKLPILRPQHPRLVSTSNACDPHGFPMSKRLEQFPHRHGDGVRLNITARMMAVQAPYNWGPKDSSDFFTRHFYRALLQRILLDYGLVKEPSLPDNLTGGSPAATNAAGSPLIVGSLKRASLGSFVAYVHGALMKLSKDPEHGPAIQDIVKKLTDEEIRGYERTYWSARKNISVIWSLMAFSASIVESVIVVDRWQFLREQEVVKSCWVEPVFEYSQSPRNLVVVGVKGNGQFKSAPTP